MVFPLIVTHWKMVSKYEWTSISLAAFQVSLPSSCPRPQKGTEPNPACSWVLRDTLMGMEAKSPWLMGRDICLSLPS